MSLAVRRAYDAPEPTDGTRVLVDRLWPRGLSLDRAALDDWLRDVAPSDGLRRWYGHDPAKFGEFSDRYRAELSDAAHAEAVRRLRAYLRAGPVTLLTATRDLALSHATVLASVIGQGSARRR
jgi:uncharacterized protein YeaO (DUF488 family)